MNWSVCIGYCLTWDELVANAYTVVWKNFVWNYFIVENVQENNFCGLPIPMKIF